MLCSECGKNNATVHVTKIVNGVKTESHLCEECAKNQESFLNLNFSMENLFSGMLNDALGTAGYLPMRGCSRCGMTFEEFKKQSKLGCSECISTFKPRLKPVIKNIQGYDSHTGKIPKRAGGKYKVQKDIEKLRTELKQMIDQEEYEKAAQIRDQIRNMESNL